MKRFFSVSSPTLKSKKKFVPKLKVSKFASIQYDPLTHFTKPDRPFVPLPVYQQATFDRYVDLYLRSPFLYFLQPLQVGPQEILNLKRELKALDLIVEHVLSNVMKRVVYKTKYHPLLGLFYGVNYAVYPSNSGDSIDQTKKLLKVLQKFPQQWLLMGGHLQSHILDKQEIQSVAKLPSQKQLLGELVGVISQASGHELVQTLEQARGVGLLQLLETHQHQLQNQQP